MLNQQLAKTYKAVTFGQLHGTAYIVVIVKMADYSQVHDLSAFQECDRIVPIHQAHATIQHTYMARMDTVAMCKHDGTNGNIGHDVTLYRRMAIVLRQHSPFTLLHAIGTGTVRCTIDQSGRTHDPTDHKQHEYDNLRFHLCKDNKLSLIFLFILRNIKIIGTDFSLKFQHYIFQKPRFVVFLWIKGNVPAIRRTRHDIKNK